MPTRAMYAIPEALLGLRESDVRKKEAINGSIQRRGNNWAVIYRTFVPDEAGNLEWKQRERVIGPAVGPEKLSKADAWQAALRDYIRPENGAVALPQGAATIRQLVEVRFMPDKTPALRRSGVEHYRYIFGTHIYPTLGDMPLRELNRHVIQQLLQAKARAGLSHQTIAHIRSALTTMLKFARGCGFWRGEIPTEGLAIGGRKAVRRQALSPMQADLLIEKTDPKWRPLMTTMRWTGLRIAEACGLRWKWVNLSGETKWVDGIALGPYSLYVLEQFAKGQWSEVPKTDEGKREIPMISEVWLALSIRREEAAASGHADEETPVWCSRTGYPYDRNNLRNRVLKPAVRRAGLPESTCWHTWRHTTGTAAHAAGMSAEDRMKFLGHADSKMMGHYTHPEAERVRGLMEAVATKRVN